MKKSEFVKEIKNYIYEILSEESVDEATYVGAAAVDDLQKDPKFVAAKDKTTAINTLKAGGSVTLEEDDEDKEPTKAELEKEKVKGAPSKFKISNEKYKELKDTLKKVVEKVKDLDKKIKDPDTKKSELEDLKDQKSKKMAALKKFIQNPELKKAFKERDVEIDTGELIGENEGSTRLTPEQEKIVNQIKAGYGIYGGKYKKATSEKEKKEIINKALKGS